MINVSQQFSDKINNIYFYSFSLGAPDSGNSFSFKAFLTDFSDQFNTNWTPQEIYGRMDPVFTYKNTIRKINLAFDVPSYDTAEAELHARTADKLIRALYPVYNIKPGGRGTALLTSPPLFKIKLANLILNVSVPEAVNSVNAKESGLLGWIDGFNFKPELESGFFVEPNIKGAQTSGKVYPKLFKVSFGFNVIHEHDLGSYNDAAGKRQPRLTVDKLPSEAFAHAFERVVATPPKEENSTTTTNKEDAPKTETRAAVFASVRNEDLTSRQGQGLIITGDQIAAMEEVAAIGEKQRKEEEERVKSLKSPQELLREQEDKDSFLFKLGNLLTGG